jgi:arabinofuranosyltransferase
MNSRLLRNALFGLLVAGFLGYAWRYILATSFVIDGTRHYILFDDAMISMRYAFNLAHGNGLVWNIGERVQGFTNPLWVFYMAALHLLPLPAAKVSLAVQITGTVLLTANLFLVRRVVEYLTDDLLAMLGAVALTAFYAPLNSYSLLGMEVSALTLIITASVWMILRNGTGRFTPWLYVLLAVSTLLRSDMAVAYVIVLASMCLIQKQHRKQHLVWGLGLLFLFLGGQAAVGHAYYGQWLPNTYYLKVTGWPLSLRILRGMYALVWFIYYTNWVLFLLPLAIFFFRRDWNVVLPLAVLLGQMAYSVFVGGDAWEDHGGANRYIVIAMPLFFASLVVSVEALRQKAVATLSPRTLTAAGSRLAWLALFSIALLNVNLLMGDWKSIERWDLVRRPDYVAGSDHNLGIALALAQTTKPGATIAVVGAGTIPYLLPNDPVLDILGKTDPVIAHEKVRTPMSIEDVPDMRPGHMKWDYAHTFGELKPDVIVQIWPGTDAEAEPYLKNYVSAVIAPGTQVYLRRDSGKILWDTVRVSD